MSNGLILWVDDEVELLRAHIIFLEKKGYHVTTSSNGPDAIELCRHQTFDLVLLDEMMPGLDGLETLQRIKEIQPSTPIVMCTKSEEENIMERAIGSKIADYLIKPVNPSQVLLSLKKNIHRKEIITEVTQTSYQQSYQQIAQKINCCNNYRDWMSLYKQLVHWELELSDTNSPMTEMLKMQKEEANIGFAKYIKNNYEHWIEEQTASQENESRPLMSPDIFKRKIFPLMDHGEKVNLVVVDNFRYDQWKVLSQEIADLFEIEEDMYMSILPTATQYARNAIFSGLMPKRIADIFPDFWVDENQEEGKNLNEESLIQTLFDRYRKKYTFSYHKINDSIAADKLIEHIRDLENNDLNVIVINFIDMLSHARTESKMVRELANNESAYRSITKSWFQHSAIADLFAFLSQSKHKVIFTTDHGCIKVTRPIKIIGDRNTNTNLRYKFGKNLNYKTKDIYAIKNPEKVLLPSPNISTSYVFATGDYFLAYPNNYNYYVSYYKDTFQHGGVSMEEMLIPLITLTAKNKNRKI